MSRKIEPSLTISVGPTLAFKDNLKETKEEAAAAGIQSSICPAGEVWEITMIFASSDASGTFHIKFKDKNGVDYFGPRKETATFISWDGKITLVEGDYVNVECPTGKLYFSMFGVKRYTRKEIEALIHEIELKFPVELPEDIQVQERIDPRM